MCAAIWSCSDEDALAFPVTRLIAFWRNHHLLDLVERPTWRVLKGRSRAYVEAAVAALDDVRTGSRVAKVARKASGGVELSVEGEAAPLQFGACVLATHTDVARKLLGAEASAEEAAALEAQLDEIRRRGYSISESEVDLGVWGVSVPIMTSNGRLEGTITLMAPALRVGNREQELVRMTVESAQRICNRF